MSVYTAYGEGIEGRYKRTQFYSPSEFQLVDAYHYWRDFPPLSY
jgi:hypothetical protein